MLFSLQHHLIDKEAILMYNWHSYLRRKTLYHNRQDINMIVELSFEAFYRQYYDRMVSYCYHTYHIPDADAEDITGDAFAQLWQQWDILDRHSLPVLIAWMRKTIRYMAYSFNRKRSKEPITVELGDWITSEEAQADVSTLSVWEEPSDPDETYEKYISTIRTKLSSKQRLLFDYIMVEHRDVKTTAQILHMNENTVKVGLKRLRAKLRNEILPTILK